MKRRGERIYQPAEIWPILSKRLICLNKRWKLMTTLFVTKCSVCNYDTSALGFGFVALSSQKLWCIAPSCLAITFKEGHFAYLVEWSGTFIPLRIISMPGNTNSAEVPTEIQTWHVRKWVLVPSGHPDPTTQKCSRAENILLRKNLSAHFDCRNCMCKCASQNGRKMPSAHSSPTISLLPASHMAWIDTSGNRQPNI